MFVMPRISSWMPSSFQRTVHVLTYIDRFDSFVLKKKEPNTSVSFSPLLMYIFRASSSSIHLFLCTQWTSGFSVIEIHADNQTRVSRRRRPADLDDSPSLTLIRPFCFLGCSTCAMFTSHLSSCVCVCVCMRAIAFILIHDCFLSLIKIWKNKQTVRGAILISVGVYFSFLSFLFFYASVSKKRRQTSKTDQSLPRRWAYVFFVFLAVFSRENYWWGCILPRLGHDIDQFISFDGRCFFLCYFEHAVFLLLLLPCMSMRACVCVCVMIFDDLNIADREEPWIFLYTNTYTYLH